MQTIFTLGTSEVKLKNIDNYLILITHLSVTYIHGPNSHDIAVILYLTIWGHGLSLDHRGLQNTSIDLGRPKCLSPQGAKHLK